MNNCAQIVKRTLSNEFLCFSIIFSILRAIPYIHQNNDKTKHIFSIHSSSHAITSEPSYPDKRV